MPWYLGKGKEHNNNLQLDGYNKMTTRLYINHKKLFKQNVGGGGKKERNEN